MSDKGKECNTTGLINVGIEIMRGCPFACGICRPPNALKPIKTDVLTKTLDHLSAFTRRGENLSVRLYGWGEPTANPRLPWIVDMVHSRFPEAHLVLSTNGLHPGNLVPIAGLLDRIAVGLDSFDDAIHLLSRGWSNVLTWRLLGALPDLSNVTIVSLLHVGNQRDVLRISDTLTISHAIKPFTIDPIGANDKIEIKVMPCGLDPVNEELSARGYTVVRWRRADRTSSGYDVFVQYDGTVTRCLTNWQSQRSYTVADLPQLFSTGLDERECGRCVDCEIGVAKRVISRGKYA